MAKTDGTVKQNDDTIVLTFERDLRHPVDKVWSRLTEPELIKTWLADGGGEIDLRVGGRVHLINEGEEWVTGAITALDAPSLLEYEFKSSQWDGGHIRFELTPSADGTRLVLKHEMPKMSEKEQREFAERYPVPEGWSQVPSTLAGWHTILDRLPHALDGEPVDWGMDVWKEHHRRYKEALARV